MDVLQRAAGQLPVWVAVLGTSGAGVLGAPGLLSAVGGLVLGLGCAAVTRPEPEPEAEQAAPPQDREPEPVRVDVDGLVQRMSASSEDAVQEGVQLAAASSDVAERFEGVARGVRSLQQAVDEVAEGAREARTIAGTALERSMAASARVANLRQAGQEIDSVTEVIASITDQTRTLALNATIEAARAGAAGKGFGVVAGEVKALASATARAAGSIAAQVRAVQDETAEAAGAIEEITATLRQMSALQDAVSGAVERQTTASGQIVGDVDLASRGSATIAGLVERRAEVLRSSYVTAALEVAQGVLANAGGLQRGTGTARWTAKDQFSGAVTTVAVPELRVGDRPVPRNDDPLRPSVLVDEVQALVGGAVTLFQRMDEGGAMLRVATTVRDAAGRRAVGTYQPVLRPDGSRNPVLTELLAGRVFAGDATILGRPYATAYAPLTGPTAASRARSSWGSRRTDGRDARLVRFCLDVSSVRGHSVAAVDTQRRVVSGDSVADPSRRPREQPCRARRPERARRRRAGRGHQQAPLPVLPRRRPHPRGGRPLVR